MSKKQNSKISKNTKKLKKKELISFCKSMASMVTAGITTTEALKFWGEKQPDLALKRAITGISLDITNGIPMNQAFAKSKKFDDTFVSLIEAGSKSGNMSEAFRAVAKRLKTEIKFTSKLKKATIIPAVIISFLFLLFIGSQLTIVPKVEGMLKDVGAEPDQFSAIIFKLSHMVQATWFIILPIIVAIIITIAMNKTLQNTLISIIASKVKLLDQVIGGFRQMTFLGTMTMLYQNGIPMAQTLMIASRVMKANPYGKQLKKVKDQNNNGLPLAECFNTYTSCDPQVSHLIAIGERTSTMANQLDQLTTMYEEETEEKVEVFTQILSAFVLALALGIISIVFVGSYLPIVLMGPKMMDSSGI